MALRVDRAMGQIGKQPTVAGPESAVVQLAWMASALHETFWQVHLMCASLAQLHWHSTVPLNGAGCGDRCVEQALSNDGPASTALCTAWCTSCLPCTSCARQRASVGTRQQTSEGSRHNNRVSRTQLPGCDVLYQRRRRLLWVGKHIEAVLCGLAVLVRWISLVDLQRQDC